MTVVQMSVPRQLFTGLFFCGLFLFNCMNNENRPNFSVAHDYNDASFNEETINEYALEKGVTTVLKFHYTFYIDDYRGHNELDAVAAHYNGRVLTADFEVRDAPELTERYSPGDEDTWYVIFHNGEVVRTFTGEHRYWLFREVLDSLFSIASPDTLPILEITWTRIADSLPFNLTAGAKVVVYEGAVRALYGDDGMIYSSSDCSNWTGSKPSVSIGTDCAVCVDTECIWVVGGAFSYSFPEGPTSYKLTFDGHSAVTAKFALTMQDMEYSFGMDLIRVNNTLMTVGGWSNSTLQYLRCWLWEIGEETIWRENGCHYRNGQSTFNFNGTYYMTGGEYMDENTDHVKMLSGFSWVGKNSTFSYCFTRRSGHAAVVVDDVAIVMGGYGGTEGGNGGDLLNDAFFTTDCLNWYRVQQVTPFPPRSQAQCVYFNGKLWLFGTGNQQDVWMGEITKKEL